MASTGPEPTDGDAPLQAVGELLQLLTDLAERCRTDGRADLAERLEARREAVAAPFVCVVVAGDYKAGKSTLVNALVGTELCPVDDDEATVVPTFVRYADEPAVLVRSEPVDGVDGGEPAVITVALDDLPQYASERGNPANHRRVRTVEVGIPSPLLREGIVLVDTPGVGGLASEYTAATLATLSMAHALLFVSDATQEYTAPELDFLAVARERCPAVLPVLTKVDLFPDWVTVRANNEGWLSQARFDDDPGLVAISADLAIRGRRDARPDLHAESGLATLVARLQDLGHEGRIRMAARAAAEVRTVTAQLAAPLRAEQDALADPHAALTDLAAAEDTGRQLASGTAEWLLLLQDGISDLDDELEREVSQRLFAVRREAEQAVLKMDPASSWDEFEANLTRKTSAEIGTASQLLVDGAHRLAQQLAEYFAQHEHAIAPTLSSLTGVEAGAVRPVGLDSGGGGSGGGGADGQGEEAGTPLHSELLEAGWGGIEAVSVIAGVLSVGLLNPVSLVIGVLMGGKSLRQARQRELEDRRQRAVESVTRYLDDTKREADRGRQLALRRVRRELRTTCQGRAEALYRSARDSLAAATRAIAAGRAGRETRAAEVDAALERLVTFERTADQLAAAMVP